MHVTLLQPGALQVLSRYGIRSVLMSRGEPLLTLLASLPGWQNVYSDNVSELYVKQAPPMLRQQVVGESLRTPAR